MQRGLRIRGWLQTLWRSCHARGVRQLRLGEMLPLGERRFVAVIEYERQRFLIGGAGGSLSLLTSLEKNLPEKHDLNRNPIGDGRL